jgi:hypothetical protein
VLYPGTHAHMEKSTTRVRKKALQMTDAPVPILRTRGTTRDHFWL